MSTPLLSLVEVLLGEVVLEAAAAVTAHLGVGLMSQPPSFDNVTASESDGSCTVTAPEKALVLIK